MRNKKLQKAVIYCRVSSNKQAKKGDGLGSQETRCREFAGHKDYLVIKVFRERHFRRYDKPSWYAGDA